MGITVWLDKLEMKVGDSLNKKIQQGISQSAWIAVVLSPDSVASPWVEKELNSALTLELEKKDVFILPILWRDCAIPLFLRDKIYADFRSSYEDGLNALLQRVKPLLDPKLLKGLTSNSPSHILASISRIPLRDRAVYYSELISNLESPSSDERVAALTALFTVRNPDVVTHLLRMTRDSSVSVRRYAVLYLGELRAKESLPIINERLSDKSPDVRAAARDAYQKITGKPA